MRIRNRRDFWAGAMFVVIGVAFAAFSQAYTLGTPARMGPGFFPTMLGVLLALLGAAIVATSITTVDHRQVETVRWRPLALILLSVLVFAIALPRLGIIASIALLVGISSLAADDFRWKETLVSIVVLVALSWLVFVKGLDLQFPVWPVFLVR
jgi:drug/metabolite transporter (DMT)-like permease